MVAPEVVWSGSALDFPGYLLSYRQFDEHDSDALV